MANAVNPGDFFGRPSEAMNNRRVYHSNINKSGAGGQNTTNYTPSAGSSSAKAKKTARQG